MPNCELVASASPPAVSLYACFSTCVAIPTGPFIVPGALMTPEYVDLNLDLDLKNLFF